jgi:hypothetical protein
LNQVLKTNENELNPGEKAKVLVIEPLCEETDVPLFLQDGSESRKCDAQDEKDKSGE